MEIRKNLKNKERELSLIVALFIMTVVFTMINPVYIQLDNLRDIVDQAAIFGLMAIGTTFVIISGGINLSIGSTLALVAVITAKLLVVGVSIPLVILIGILVGFFCGLLDGVLISKFKLQPFIATLGTMSLYRGLAFVFTAGLPVTGISRVYRNIINGKLFFDIRFPIILLIFVVAIAFVVLKYTRFGNYVYAIGGNEEATRLSGVKIHSNKIIIYGIGSVGTALAALVLIARLGTGEPTAGQGYELNAIAAVAIGGTSMAGGRGSVIGTFLGAILFSGLKTGLIVSGVDTFYQYIATGLVIIVAAYIEVFQAQLSALNKNKLKKNE